MKKYYNYVLLVVIVFFGSGLLQSQNIITDGDFSTTTEIINLNTNPQLTHRWSYYVNESEGIDISPAIIDGICKFEITNLGSSQNFWDIQLIQQGFELKHGHTYELTFDVRADSNRSFRVFLGEVGGSWTSLIGHDKWFDATYKWQTITIPFEAFAVFPLHKLSFEFGLDTTPIYFDNISLKDIGLLVSSSTLKNPGFRPESDLSKTFIKTFKTSKFTIYPTIIRTIDSTSWSESSAKEFSNLFSNEFNIKVKENNLILNPGELLGKGQFGFFMNDLKKLEALIEENNSTNNYSIILEILFAPQRSERLDVFGIHIFILNSLGKNAFSFLLNSHHDYFSINRLFSENSNKENLEILKLKCSRVAFDALKKQIEYAQEIDFN